MPDENGVWRTISGRRVFIKSGQSLTEAMRDSGKFEENQLKEPSKSDTIKPTNTKAVEEELFVLRQFGEQTGNEHLTIMTDDGKVLGYNEGRHDTVSATPELQRKINEAPVNSIVFAHNHPENTGLSDDDVAILSHPSIKEIHAVGHDGKTYSMSVGSGKRPSSDEIKSAGRKLDKAVEAKLGQMIRDGKLTPMQATMLHAIEKGELFARLYGWKYERGKVDG